MAQQERCNLKNIKVNDMSLVGCIFKVQKFKEDGTITYDGEPFHNIVLDSGLDAMYNTSIYNLTQRLHVGVSGVAVSGTNTSLFDEITYLDNTSYSYSGDDLSGLPYARLTKTWNFSVGSVTGDLKELGLSSTSNVFFNRQLFLDSYGDPITITVLEDEGLRVSADIRMYGDMSITDSENGSFLFNGDTVNFVRKISGTAFTQTHYYYTMLHYDSCFTRTHCGLSSATTGYPSGTRASSFTALSGYVSGSYEHGYKAVWNANVFTGNINIISVGYYGLGSSSTYIYPITCFYLSAPINITSVEEVTINYKRKWGRYIP